jgi:two-component system sensor histidine kinase CpxA
MKSITLKMFLSYWAIMMGVNIASDLIAPEQMRRYPLIRQAILSAMQIPAQKALDAYEEHGCGADTQYSLPSGDTLYIADTNGRTLCTDIAVPGLESLAAKVRGDRSVMARRFDSFQVVATSMQSRRGRRYVLFLKSRYTSKVNLLTWLFPGPTTVAVSCAVTLVFAVLLTLPLRRLRTATRQIALGNLDVRVPMRRRMIRFGRAVIDDDLDRLALDFNHMAERLQGLVHAQHLLLRDVSHELRSPLARLNVALELSRREGGGHMQNHLDRIEREAQRLNDLIAQLLSLSCMEITREIRDATPVSLSDLVRDVLPNIQYEASLRGCRIASVMGQNCVVRGDARLLESALENILRNALRYTPENGVIEVDLAETECDQKKIAELSVCDRGPGVPAEELDAILRPFYRVDNSRQSKTGGFGVGLAIADRAVRLHGGSIVAANRPDGGLVVRMRFPAA